ncbi:MAG TPA: TolC family protein, partial [Flavitalea sp.]|nr:TolC family protein [Flavitalea sp.]
MTLQKAFIYTISFFTLLCLLSYAAFSQAQPLSMKQALDLTMSNNRQIKISALEVDRSEQQIAAAKGQSLPEAGLNGQLIHYFEVPAFFGFDNSGG